VGTVAKKSVLLLDSLAGNRGHLIDDDLFLSKCIAPLADDFLIASSPTSIANLQDTLDVSTYRLHSDANRSWFTRARLFRIICSLPCANYEHIVFQSFEEISTLLFMLLHPSKHIHIIVTNNLRPDRLQRHPQLGAFFLRQIFFRAASVIVHSQHEVQKVVNLVPGINPQNIFVKPFHKISQRHEQAPALNQRNRTILFLGPEFTHKKIDPVLELIKRDQLNRYQYQFCSMEGIPDELQTLSEKQDNIEVLQGYISDRRYYQLFRESSLIILTHDHNYEGVLSGAFCDAMASGTPVISRKIAPVTEYFEQYGPLGFIVDFDEPSWFEKVLEANIENEYPTFQKNIALLRDSCNIESIRDVFRKVLRDNAPRQLRAA